MAGHSRKGDGEEAIRAAEINNIGLALDPDLGADFVGPWQSACHHPASDIAVAGKKPSSTFKPSFGPAARPA
jgi:hypothetical protein